jgi:hypothetical protein
VKRVAAVATGIALLGAPAAGAADTRVVVERAGRIDVIDAQGRPADPVLPRLPGDASAVAWSPDGSRISYVRDDAVNGSLVEYGDVPAALEALAAARP